MVTKTEYFGERTCPKCHTKLLKNWAELTSDEKLLAEKLPLSAEFSTKERERHLFCTNCWYETPDFETKA